MCMYTYLSVCVWSAISKHFQVHLKCGTNSGSYFSCLIRRCTTALHGMLSSDTHLRQLLQHPPTPSSSPAVAIVCACLRAGQFFPLLPIIFTKKLHSQMRNVAKAAKCNKCRCLASMVCPLPMVSLLPLTCSLPLLKFTLTSGNSRAQTGNFLGQPNCCRCCCCQLVRSPPCLHPFYPATFRSALCEPQVPN